MPTLFYKGVGVGTHHHPIDLRATGIMPRAPGALNAITVQQHVALGTTYSSCISLTKSYGVAQDYAKNAGLAAPTRALPAYVYQVEIPDDPGIPIIDPVDFIASKHANPLVSPSYHHDGDQGFLGYVAYPSGPAYLGVIPLSPRPPGMAGTGTHPVHRSIQLDTIVFAIRDAEVLVHGGIPNTWITIRHDVY
jgi:hypothetical protein